MAHKEEEDYDEDFDNEPLEDELSEDDEEYMTDNSVFSTSEEEDIKNKEEKPVILGYMSERIPFEEDIDAYSTKVGGKPVSFLLIAIVSTHR